MKVTRRLSENGYLPQHHEVEFGLTHKVNFSYTLFLKSDFLPNLPLGSFIKHASHQVHWVKEAKDSDG